VLSDAEEQAGDILSGKLTCCRCRSEYPIAEGMPFFGVGRASAVSLVRQMEAEHDWEWRHTSLSGHLEYAHSHFPKSSAVISHLKEATLGGATGKSVLDAGAATCALSYLLARYGFKTIGLEFLPEKIAVGESYSRLARFERVVSGVELLPFLDGIFDVVFCSQVAHHIVDLKSLFGEFRRVLRPDGVIVLREPSKPRYDWLQRAVPDQATEAGLGHQNHSLFDYLAAVRACGFAVGEMHVTLGAGRTHPKLARAYYVVQRIVGADQWQKGGWFKRLGALFSGGDIIIIGRNTVSSIDLSPKDRFVQIISAERLARFRGDIVETSDNIAPFVALLDQAYQERPNG
jgi:SAM-dependent methyltransferase